MLLCGVLCRFELAMQQNEIMNVFYDDWMGLAEEDSSFGSKADNHLKEYQSFTDLKFSKDKSITCVEWHPVIRGSSLKCTLSHTVPQRSCQL